jgi:hypothetical protein
MALRLSAVFPVTDSSDTKPIVFILFVFYLSIDGWFFKLVVAILMPVVEVLDFEGKVILPE